MTGILIVLGAFASALPRLSADTVVLKDGKKLTGTIVGFENGMFRVETEFGYELVRKDKVETIQISQPEGGPMGVPEPAGTRPGQTPEEKHASRAPRSSEANAAVPTPAVSHPLNESLPKQIRDRVDGADYINDTFHFVMFKPLGWKLLDDIRKETTTGIAAMGSEDEQTLLIVDRQVWSGTPNLQTDHIVLKLRNTYQEYRILSEERVEIGGLPAVRSLFSGVVDGVEWHGVTAHVERGNTVFGIIGLTSAETYQFQEAVFDKIIRSFHFADQSATSRASEGPP